MIKKHFKKLVSVALTAVMALGMTTTAFANEKDTLNLDAALMEKGYPQIVLDTMDEDTKMDIYNEGDIAFCGAVITYMMKTVVLIQKSMSMKMELILHQEGKSLHQTFL